MKNKYTKPTMEVVLIKGGRSFLSGSGEGFNATISGYEEASTEDGDGFSQ